MVVLRTSTGRLVVILANEAALEALEACGARSTALKEGKDRGSVHVGADRGQWRTYLMFFPPTPVAGGQGTCAWDRRTEESRRAVPAGQGTFPVVIVLRTQRIGTRNEIPLLMSTSGGRGI